MTPDESEQPIDAAGRAGIENLTLWQRVHEHLRQEILDNRLPPGTYFYRASGANSVAGGRIVVLH